MTKHMILAVVLAVSVVTGACSQPTDVSMTVTFAERGPDGRDWDAMPDIGVNGESTWAGLGGLASHAPDPVLTLITEDGGVLELAQAPQGTGMQDSICENRYSCTFSQVALPGDGQYYAIVVTDLDARPSPSGIWNSVRTLFGGESDGSTPLNVVHEFGGAAIVASGWFGPDEERVAALESRVRAYLEEHGARLTPSDGFPVVSLGDCSNDGCTIDEAGTVVLQIE